MTAKDYPITEGFGCQPGYPLNQSLCPAGQGFHNGIDYGCPEGTPIVVNGITIGISGATGYVTGPHLHVGKWNGGTVMNPGSGGFSFKSAVVTEINEDPTNGKYVRVQGDGHSWVYLHMSDNKKVKVGQTLEGDDMYKGRFEDKTIELSAHGWYDKAVHYRKRTIEEKAKSETLTKEIAKLKSQLDDATKDVPVLKPGTYKVK